MVQRLNPNIEDKTGSTPIIYAIKSKNIPVLAYASSWNERVDNGNLKFLGYKKFDLVSGSRVNGMTPLHYCCAVPSLNMINDIISRNSKVNPIELDYKLRMPSDLIDKSYLSSKKVMLRYEKKAMKKLHSYDENSSLRMQASESMRRNFMGSKELTQKKKAKSWKKMMSSLSKNTDVIPARKDISRRERNQRPKLIQISGGDKGSFIDFPEEKVSINRVMSSKRPSSKVTTKSNKHQSLVPSMIREKNNFFSKGNNQRFSEESRNPRKSEAAVFPGRNDESKFIRFQNLVIKTSLDVCDTGEKICKMEMQNENSIKNEISDLHNSSLNFFGRSNSISSSRHLDNLPVYSNKRNLVFYLRKKLFVRLNLKIRKLIAFLRIYKQQAGINFNFIKGSKIHNSSLQLLKIFEKILDVIVCQMNVNENLKSFFEQALNSFMVLFNILSSNGTLMKPIENSLNSSSKKCYRFLCMILNQEIRNPKKINFGKKVKILIKEILVTLKNYLDRNKKFRTNFTKLVSIKNGFNSVSSLRRLRPPAQKKNHEYFSDRKNSRVGSIPDNNSIDREPIPHVNHTLDLKSARAGRVRLSIGGKHIHKRELQRRKTDKLGEFNSRYGSNGGGMNYADVRKRPSKVSSYGTLRHMRGHSYEPEKIKRFQDGNRR